MKALLALAAVMFAIAALPTAASATTNVCGPKCWGIVFNGGWVDPDENPIAGGIGGQVQGGDGATCSLADVFDECDFDANPCAGYECNGDEGTGEVCVMDSWIVLCNRRVSGHFKYPHIQDPQTYVTDESPIEEHPVEYVQCPGTDDPAYDPNNDACW